MSRCYGEHAPSRQYLGNTASTQYAVRLRAIMDFRNDHEAMFYDIHHQDLLADPVGEVERLYSWLGWPIEQPYRDALDAWLARRMKGENRGGSPLPDIDWDGVARQFDFYMRRFLDGRTKDPRGLVDA